MLLQERELVGGFHAFGDHLEVERVRHDEEFMGKLREITERDKEILDRLAQ